MKICPNCGTQNNDDDNFCEVCGARLPDNVKICPKCGSANDPENSFCEVCGARLDEMPEDDEDSVNPATAEVSGADTDKGTGRSSKSNDELIKAVRALKNGDQEAFGTIYELTNKGALATIKRYCDSSADYEDILQDTYLKVYQSIGDLRDDSNIKAWINKIAANTAIRANMKKKPTMFSEMEDDEGQEPEFEDESTDFNPEAISDRNAVSEIVREILDTLPDDQRDALWMVYGQRVTIREMAENLGISENTIKSRLYQGRQKMMARKADFRKYGIELSSAVIGILIAMSFEDTVYAAEIGAAGAGAAAGAGVSGAVGNAVVEAGEASAAASAVTAASENTAEIAGVVATEAAEGTVDTAAAVSGAGTATEEATAGSAAAGSMATGTAAGSTATSAATAGGTAATAGAAASTAAAATGLSLAAKIGIAVAVAVIGGGAVMGVTAVRSSSAGSSVIEGYEQSELPEAEILSVDEDDKEIFSELLDFYNSTDDTLELLGFIREHHDEIMISGLKYFNKGNVVFNGEDLVLNGNGTGFSIKWNDESDQGGSSGSKNDNLYRIYFGDFTAGIPDGKITVADIVYLFKNYEGINKYNTIYVTKADVDMGVLDGDVSFESINEKDETDTAYIGTYHGGDPDGTFILTLDDIFAQDLTNGSDMMQSELSFEAEYRNGVFQETETAKVSSNGKYISLIDVTGRYSGTDANWLSEDQEYSIPNLQAVWTEDFLTEKHKEEDVLEMPEVSGDISGALQDTDTAAVNSAEGTAGTALREPEDENAGNAVVVIPPLEEEDKEVLQDLLAYCQSTDDALQLIIYVEDRLMTLYDIGNKYFSSGNVLFNGEDLVLDGSGTGLVLKDHNSKGYKTDSEGERVQINEGSTCYIYFGDFSEGVPNGTVKSIAMEHQVPIVEGEGYETLRENTSYGRVVTAEVENGIWNGEVMVEVTRESDKHELQERCRGNYTYGVMNGAFILDNYYGNYYSDNVDGQSIPDLEVTYEIEVIAGEIQFSEFVSESDPRYADKNILVTDRSGKYSTYNGLLKQGDGYYQVGDFEYEKRNWLRDFNVN